MTYFNILQILQVSSPPKGQYVSEVGVSDSEEVSDSDDSNSDEDQSLINVISPAHRRQSQPITAKDFQESDLHAESPPLPEISNDNFADLKTVQQFSTPVPSCSQTQSYPTVQHFTTPVPSCGRTQSLEYTTPSLYQQTSVSDLDGLFDDSDVTGKNSSS